jgi:hypothetical protein
LDLFWEAPANLDVEAEVAIELTGSLILLRAIPGKQAQSPLSQYGVRMLDGSLKADHDILSETCLTLGSVAQLKQHDVPLTMINTGDPTLTLSDRFFPVMTHRILLQVTNAANADPAAGEIQLFWDPAGRL